MNKTVINESYIAGFFDGEGSAMIITIHRKNNRVVYQFRPSIMIAQKTVDVLSAIKEYLGFGTIVSGGTNASKYVIKNRKDCITFANKIAPYTFIKTKQLFIVKEFCTIMKMDGQPYSKDKFIQVLNLRDDIFDLNCITRSGMKQKYPREVILKEQTFFDKNEFDTMRSRNGLKALINYQKNR